MARIGAKSVCLARIATRAHHPPGKFLLIRVRPVRLHADLFGLGGVLDSAKDEVHETAIGLSGKSGHESAPIICSTRRRQETSYPSAFLCQCLLVMNRSVGFATRGILPL